MQAVANPTGRLVTCRVVTPSSEEQHQHTADELRRIIALIKGKVVVVSDLRSAATFSPESSARFAAVMRSDHARIERTATLVNSASPTLVLQLARVAREAGHPGRRIFVSQRELIDWVSPVLTRDEQLAVDAFLGAC